MISCGGGWFSLINHHEHLQTPAFSYFPGSGQQLRFEVKIVLPAGKNGDALHIKSFETETSNYSQEDIP
jgi:hypothetical protein